MISDKQSEQFESLAFEVIKEAHTLAEKTAQAIALITPATGEPVHNLSTLESTVHALDFSLRGFEQITQFVHSEKKDYKVRKWIR